MRVDRLIDGNPGQHRDRMDGLSELKVDFGPGFRVYCIRNSCMPKTETKTTIKTTPYDVAEHLRTPEEMAAYLDAWLEEAPDDAAGIAKALGSIARAKGMTQVAKDAGLSRESLYRALSADGNPSFSTVLKVARALGVKLHAAAA